MITGAIVPLYPMAGLASLSLKQEVLHLEGSGVTVSLEGNVLYAASGAWAGVPHMGDEHQSSFHARLGPIGSYQITPEFALHTNIGIWGRFYTSDSEINSTHFFSGFGTDYRITNHIVLLGEFITVTDYASSDLQLANVGIRLHSRRLALDVAYMHPFGESDRFKFPLATLGYRF